MCMCSHSSLSLSLSVSVPLSVCPSVRLSLSSSYFRRSPLLIRPLPPWTTPHTQALAGQYKAECIGSGDATGTGTGMAAPSPSPLFPAGKALSLLDAHASGVADDRDRAAFWSTASDLAKVLLQVSRSGRSLCCASREKREKRRGGGGGRIASRAVPSKISAGIWCYCGIIYNMYIDGRSSREGRTPGRGCPRPFCTMRGRCWCCDETGCAPLQPWESRREARV